MASNTVPIEIIAYGSPEYQKALALRYKVMREPVGLQFTEEEYQRDAMSIHIVAIEGHKLLGCMMLLVEDHNSQVGVVRQVVVSEESRGRGIGQQLMAYAEALAKEKGCIQMMMHARKVAVGFYEKLGYETYGEEFTQSTLPHYKMRKVLV